MLGLNFVFESLEIWLHFLKAFEYVHSHHFDDVDWFLKADDDTYIIMENLRWFLSEPV